MSAKAYTIQDHIAKNIQLDFKTGCWNWIGSFRSKTGRPCMTVNGRTVTTYRQFYEYYNNTLLNKNILICHKCDNYKCVNPEHLFIGSQNDNIQDMVKKRRHCFGEAQWDAKLSEVDVLNIRRKFQPRIITYKDLAKEYKVSKSTIGKILNRLSWKHI